MLTQKKDSLLTNIFSLAAGELIAKSIAFLMLIYLARVMGPDGFGIIGLAFAIVSYFVIIPNAGLDPVGAREIARNHTMARTIAGSIIGLRFFLSLFAYMLLLVLILFLREQVLQHFLLIEGFIIIASAFSLLFFYQGIERMSFNAIARIITTSVTALGVILFVRGYDDILLVPVCSLLGITMGILFHHAVLMKIKSGIKIRFSPAIWKKYLYLSLTIGIAISLLTVYRGLDVIMLGIFRSTKEVGLYHAAYRIMMAAIIIPGLMAASYFPRIARLKKSPEELNSFLNHTLRIFITAGIPVGIIGFFISGPLIGFFFGSEFIDATLALKLLFLHLLLVYWNFSAANALLALDRQNLYFIVVLIGFASNIILNSIFIPRHGIVGAAAATFAAETLIFLSATYALSNTTGLKIAPILMKPIVLGVSITFLIAVFHALGMLFVGLLLGSAIYILGIIYLNILTKSDYRILRAIDNRTES